MKSLRAWQEDIHQNAIDHGFIKEGEQRPFPEIVALCASELFEAFEEYRKPDARDVYTENGKPEGIAIEMADALIRILDWFEERGLDAETCVNIKHEFNKNRPWRHGGKVV